MPAIDTGFMDVFCNLRRPFASLRIALLCAFLPASLFAAGLVIKKDGEGFWVDSMTLEGALYSYVTDKQQPGSIPQPEVATLIPSVERGKNYTEEEIKANIEKIDDAIKKYLPSRKHLIRLKGQWQAAESGFDEATGQNFDKVLINFKQSPRGRAEYEKALMDLEMLKFKDAAGKHDAKAAAIKTEMIDILLGIKLGEFEQKSTVGKMRVPDYYAVRDQAADMLKKDLPTEVRERVQAGLDQARGTVLNQWIPYGRMNIEARPSIDSYMRGRTMLFLLQDEVAQTEEEKQRITDEFASTRDMIKAKFPQCDYSLKDFILTPSDLKKLAATAKAASKHDVEGVTSETEYAFLIPTTAPFAEELSGSMQFIGTVVFDRAWFKKMEYSLAVAAKSGPDMKITYFPLKGFRTREAHGSIHTRLSFNKMPGARPMEAPDGGECIYLAFAIRPAGTFQHDQAGWEIISKCTVVPVGPRE